MSPPAQTLLQTDIQTILDKNFELLATLQILHHQRSTPLPTEREIGLMYELQANLVTLSSYAQPDVLLPGEREQHVPVAPSLCSCCLALYLSFSLTYPQDIFAIWRAHSSFEPHRPLLHPTSRPPPPRHRQLFLSDVSPSSSSLSRLLSPACV